MQAVATEFITGARKALLQQQLSIVRGDSAANFYAHSDIESLANALGAVLLAFEAGVSVEAQDAFDCLCKYGELFDNHIEQDLFRFGEGVRAACRRTASLGQGPDVRSQGSETPRS